MNARFSVASRPQPTFHDLRVNHTQDYSRLVDPSSPQVRELARRLGTLECAQREFYCFNDSGFALLSQRNRTKTRHP